MSDVSKIKPELKKGYEMTLSIPVGIGRSGDVSIIDVEPLYKNNEIEELDLNTTTPNVESLQQFYETFKISDSSYYGVDQSIMESLCYYKQGSKNYTYAEANYEIQNAISFNKPIPHFSKIESPDYRRLKNKLMEQGFSVHDSDFILNRMDSTGICSYATICNEIFNQYKDHPEDFEKIFGYSMFKVNDDGSRVTLNSEEFLVDLFVYMNSEENGGQLFKDHKIKKDVLLDVTDVLGGQPFNADYQIYLMKSNSGKNTDMINKFLQAKDSSLTYKWNKILDTYDSKNNKQNSDPGDFSIIDREINKGNSVSLSFYYDPEKGDKPIRMLSFDKEKYDDFSTDQWIYKGAHEVTVTGMTNDSIIVSSGGAKYEIPKSDLQGSRYQFVSSKIVTK